MQCIVWNTVIHHICCGRSPRGERGLKPAHPRPAHSNPCRSPRGERGLKPNPSNNLQVISKSLPAWGAWIETKIAYLLPPYVGSLPAWGAWIETLSESQIADNLKSLPAWGAWIETGARRWTYRRLRRSPRGERGLKRVV